MLQHAWIILWLCYIKAMLCYTKGMLYLCAHVGILFLKETGLTTTSL